MNALKKEALKKEAKRLSVKIFMFMIILLFAPCILPNTLQMVEAATVKINKKEVTLNIGETLQLNIDGINSKVSWSSSRKSVCTVSSDGLVTGIKVGTTIVKAKVNEKSYTYNVKVLKPSDNEVKGNEIESVDTYSLQAQINAMMPLKGKKGAGFGDSITWGQIPGGQTKNPWTKVFGDISGATMTNKGIGGTTMAVGSSVYGFPSGYDAYAFCNRVDTEDLSAYDFIILLYGTNDYGYAIDMGSDTDTSKTTFKGALNYSLDKLSKTYPHLQVIVMTPTYAKTSLVANVKGYRMNDYVEAVKTITRKYNYQVIDLHNSMGINIANWESYYWDFLHPTEKTYALIAQYVYANFFNNVSKEEQYTSGNLLPYNVFNTISGGYFTNFEELGDTLSLAAGQYKESQHGFSPLQNQTYLIDLCYGSASSDQYVEFDFYNGTALCNAGFRTRVGENKVQLKLTTPSKVDRNTQYSFRVAASADNTTAVNITQLSLKLVDSSPQWGPPEGSKRNKKWSRATITSPNKALTDVLYYKDAEGFVHFYGKVFVTLAGQFMTIPTNCAPQYALTSSVMNTNGTPSYIIIDTNGAISVPLNGVFDLSSIPPYFGDDVSITNVPQ